MKFNYKYLPQDFRSVLFRTPFQLFFGNQIICTLMHTLPNILNVPILL